MHTVHREVCHGCCRRIQNSDNRGPRTQIPRDNVRDVNRKRPIYIQPRCNHIAADIDITGNHHVPACIQREYRRELYTAPIAGNHDLALCRKRAIRVLQNELTSPQPLEVIGSP